jgi:hypothetical protein
MAQEVGEALDIAVNEVFARHSMRVDEAKMN